MTFHKFHIAVSRVLHISNLISLENEEKEETDLAEPVAEEDEPSGTEDPDPRCSSDRVSGQ